MNESCKTHQASISGNLDRASLSLLEELKKEGRLRVIPAEGKQDRVDLLSNDYLGLALKAAEFREEYLDRFADAAMTSSASRLLSRDHRYHNMLEEQIGALYGKQALLFNSGYHANTGAISALSSIPGTIFIADKMVHASIIDGFRIANARFARYPHNDITALERLIQRYHDEYDNIVIVTEGIFSMHGDVAPIMEIAELKRKYTNLAIYLDEAHSFGTLGQNGLGLAEECGVSDNVDISVVTFGKALASSGAAIITSAPLRELLVNRARSFIFSTALPPACCAWTSLMIEKMMGMMAERRHLGLLSEWLRNQIELVTGNPTGSDSHIIPLVTGDNLSAIAMSEKLRSKGYDVLPIRRPTVPPGREGVRLSLNASLDQEILYNFLKAINK